MSGMRAVFRRCASAVIDRVIRRCGAVIRSVCGLGGYCHFVVVGVQWRQCHVDRGEDVVVFGRVRNHVTQRQGSVLWRRGINRFVRGGWCLMRILRRCGGRRGWAQRGLAGRFEFV